MLKDIAVAYGIASLCLAYPPNGVMLSVSFDGLSTA